MIIFLQRWYITALRSIYSTFCKGDEFRKEFSQLGEVRSLIPEGIHIMALTATATRSTHLDICHTLGMKDPSVVTVILNKGNIKYELAAKPGTIEEPFSPLVGEVRRNREHTDRTIIYCRMYDSCSQIYIYITASLGRERTQPVGVCDLARFRLVDMFSACTTTAVRNSILESFSIADATLRIVIATVAFGMGIDCPNVRKIIHWGAPDDIEFYLQETGRAGRDGLPASAILYPSGDTLHNTDTFMKDYISNRDKCRRKLLLEQFEGTVEDNQTVPSYMCCDICEGKCS